MTEAIYRVRGSLGSRLCRAADGTWVAIAQWPDEQTLNRARELGSADAQAAQLMREGIEEFLSEERLEAADDLFRAAPFRGPPQPDTGAA